jgi:hypothetical protein
MARVQPTENAMNVNAKSNTAEALGTDLRYRTERRGRRDAGVGGAWATGTVAGHRFQALVFPGHAESAGYELGGDSRVSKLWVARLADDAVVYNWDRGADVPPADARAEAVVNFLAARLAARVFPEAL